MKKALFMLILESLSGALLCDQVWLAQAFLFSNHLEGPPIFLETSLLFLCKIPTN